MCEHTHTQTQKNCFENFSIFTQKDISIFFQLFHCVMHSNEIYAATENALQPQTRSLLCYSIAVFWHRTVFSFELSTTLNYV